ncbi:MAG: alpha/beta fold hydrolase, partial [Chloroflexota bacterium]|nr:alpha/beta fold hydrolase [Chloroflexota bacterium]
EPKVVARQITLPATVTPLVFIPGISGSYLDHKGWLYDDELWLGNITDDRTPLSRYRSVHGNNLPTVVAPDVIRTAYGTDVYTPLLQTLHVAGYREYKVDRKPERRTANGCDDDAQRGNNPNLFLFAYDWRLSNVDNARALKDYVGCIQQFYPDAKINILAHSMGGLVARRYILDNPSDNRVNALISVATPWLGAPKAINALETGEFLGLKMGIGLGIPNADLKWLMGSFTGAHELVPSEAYTSLGAPKPMGEEGWNWDGDNTAYEGYEYNNLVSVVDSRYGQGEFKAGTSSKSFHSHATTLGAQDNWNTPRDATGVKYYHIYGITATDTTIERVFAYAPPRCQGLLSSLCAPLRSVKLSTGRGDGTVPALSARRTSADGTKNFNAPNATVKRPVKADGRTPDGNNEHVGIMSNLKAHELILQYLSDSTRSESQVQATDVSVSASGAVDDLPPSLPAHYLTLEGIKGWVVSDDLGNSTAPSNESDTLGGLVPGVTIHSLGENADEIIMNADQRYTVLFRTSAGPMFIEVLTGTADTTTHAIRYSGLSLPANVIARLNFSPEGIETLQYDSNGDGSFDASIRPSVNVSGALANDREPPVVTATQSGQNGKTLVSLTAQDNTEGLSSLFYSLDGTNFQQYDRPLAIDPTVQPRLYAFADDQVGNRSSLYETDVQLFNVAPVVGAVSGPIDPVAVNTAITANATFSDANVTDAHTATWDWGDGNVTQGTVTEANGTGSVRDNHTYTSPGVYAITLTVTDQDGASNTSTFNYTIAYDPNGGFVTGGGWINSPAGAYPADPGLSGRANFGFVAKYQKGATRPTGTTEFEFKAGKLNFQSTNYQWLVVSGAKAQYKGTGAINGAGDYGFLVTLTDGQVKGGGGIDKFRIKIWKRSTGTVVYDTQMGAAEDVEATTALGGGSIVIHAK